MTTVIDLTRVAAPTAIDALSYEELLSAFKVRFQAFWEEARLADASLPAYDESMLETSPPIIVGQAWSYLRLLDRQRVNDALKALLAPLSTGSNLDNLVARQGIQRLTITAASGSTPAVMESDARLLERYLLSFNRAAAGSRDGYLFAAFTAWPGAGDIEVVGRRIHGRRGDVDIVVAGPDGDAPSTENLALVRAAVTADDVQPETTSVSVLAATRVTYAVDLVIEVLKGPDPEIVKDEAVARIRAVADDRTFIGGEVPASLLSGAAYGTSVMKVRDNAPVVIAPDPYSIPVLTTITVSTEVRT
ncbi:MAG: baseplate J/gp47 family protein [Hoeflea sp.]|nr:baseplate J/gp47 family protein [Hoeflea sp.]